MILRLVLPILKLWRFRLRVLCWVLYLCFLVPTMSLLQTLKLLWVFFDWFNISLSDSLSLENLRSCVVVVFWSCVERVAWEETRVQEEGEPVCEKVSRNVMSNSELSTFLMISLYGVSSKLRHVPLSERHNLVYIFFFCCVQNPDRSEKCCWILGKTGYHNDKKKTLLFVKNNASLFIAFNVRTHLLSSAPSDLEMHLYKESKCGQ